MTGKDGRSKAAIVIIADGFDEPEAVAILSSLRQAGMYAKSVGLVSGLISGSHGILVMPDVTLTDLHSSLDVASIGMAFLPGGDHHLANLEPDPRVHRLLRQIADQQGWIVTNKRGQRVLKHASLREGLGDEHVLLLPVDQPMERLVQDLVRRLGLSG